MKSLDLLANVQVASPCPANWEDMAGDEHVRFCGQCDKNVYNLSALTSAAATALILEHEGNLCGRFFRRADGTLLTADCPVGVHHRLRRKRRLAMLATSLAGFLTLSGCTKFEETSTSTPSESGGSNAVIQPPEERQVMMPAQRAGLAKGQECVLGKIEMPRKQIVPVQQQQPAEALPVEPREVGK